MYRAKSILLFGILCMWIACSTTGCDNLNSDTDSGSPILSYQELFQDPDKLIEVKSRELEFRKGFKLHSEELKQDLLWLKEVMEKHQTPLYRYSSKSEIDSVFQLALDIPGDSADYHNFTKSLARIFSCIGCMHSSWGHASYYKIYRKKHLKIFPFKVLVDKGKVYLLENYSLDTSLQPGSQILQIKHKPVANILDDLSEYMTADGGSKRVRLRGASDYFPMAYSNFLDQPESFELEIQNGHINREVKVSALSPTEIDSLKQERYPPNSKFNPLPLQLQMVDSLATAIYTIKSFRNEYLATKGQQFQSFNDSVFALLKKEPINNLVIDIRDNFGGWTGNGRSLFSYFIDKNTPYIEKVKVSPDTSFAFKELLTSPSPYNDTMEIKQGLWYNYPNLVAYPKVDQRFEGVVYILVNENSKSCSSIFSSLMRENTNAIFVGSEVGGAQCGSNGMTVSFKLPYSQIGITLSTAQYESAVANSNPMGIVPDFEIQPNIHQVLANRDSIMEFVLVDISKR